MYALFESDIKSENRFNREDNELALNPQDGLLYAESVLDAPNIRYGYRISDLMFMVPESTTCEVIQNQQIFKLPNSPQWIHGLINIRGNITPVMNLHTLLYKAYDNKMVPHIIVIDKGNKAIAFLADELPHSLVKTDKKSSINSLPDFLSKFCSPGFKNGSDDWYEFDIQSFFITLGKSQEN